MCSFSAYKKGLERWKKSSVHKREYVLQKNNVDIKKVGTVAYAKLTHQHIPDPWPEWQYVADGMLADREPDYWRVLLCLSQNRLFHDDFNTAVIFEAMAFEVAFAEWALPHLRTSGKSATQIESWHRQSWPKKLGIEAGNISGTNWMTNNSAVFDKIKDCRNHSAGLLDVRNGVIHQGGSANSAQAKDGYKDVRNAIKELLGK